MKIRRRCKCGCGQITNPGRKYITGHVVAWNKGTGKTKIRRICKCGCGGITNYGKKYIYGHNVRGENNPFFGRHHIDKTKKIISITNKGNRYRRGMSQPSTKGKLNPTYRTGYYTVKAEHNKFKKLYCEKCNSKIRLEIHHDPSMDEYNCLEWKGRVWTLCRTCHMNEHRTENGQMGKILYQGGGATVNKKKALITGI